MDEKMAFIEPLLEKAEVYGKTSLELLKLKAVQQTAMSGSVLASRSLALMAFVMFGLMASIAAALWIGEFLASPYLGFLIVSGFYAVLGLVFYFLTHRWMKRRVANTIVRGLLN